MQGTEADSTAQNEAISNKRAGRLRVLLIAEAANPEWTSVPLIGWKLSRALAEVVNVHLVTQVRNRNAIIRAGCKEGRDFSAIDNETFAAPLFWLSRKLRGGDGKGWTTITAFSSLAYYSFEFELWRQFRARLQAGEFDLVHRITPLSPTSPSIIAKKLAALGVPFIIGPLNGGIPWPKGFRDRQHAEREWMSYIRGLYKLLPAYKSTRRYASAIIAGSRFTYDQMPGWTKHKCVFIPENGVSRNSLSIRRHSISLPLKCAFVGRLVPYKGADILLEAAVESMKAGKLEIDIVGDGPQRAQLEALVARLGVQKCVRFHGFVSHAKAQDIIRNSDFFGFPSVREFGGGVVVESMALGVPPIVANYGGPSELVTDKTGIRVAFQNKENLVSGFKLAIEQIIERPSKLDELGTAGHFAISDKLTWDAKARQILAVYNSVLSGTRDLTFHNFQ